MRLLVLGPLEVREGGRVLEIGGGRQRALLARLLVHGQEVVTSERLIEDLWHGGAPASAAKLVQGYVSRLRSELGSHVISTVGRGYALHGVETDAAEFERLLREAQGTSAPREALRAFRAALALWRGPPLADFVYEPWAQVEIGRLEELRLTAVEEALALRLELGEAAELVSELEALVREHPLRERSWSHLMLALYRCGRQADALEAYRQARLFLIEGLGIEPSRALRELEQAILRQDASLDYVAAPGTCSAGRPFIGRERELAELLRGLDDAVAGRGGLFLLQGEPGIGKSRLADELLEHARQRDVRVLVGRCWEAGGAPAFWPWVQSLRPLADTEIEDLAQLVPGLAGAPLLESDAVRFRLFEGVAQFVRRAAEMQPLVLFLDDMHAADESSLLFLRFVAREIAGSRLLVVAAYRDVDPAMAEALVIAVTELMRESRTRRIALTGMSVPEVRRYVELVSGEAPSDDVLTAINEETEGNPFFVGEIARLIAVEGDLGAPNAVGIVIPQSVREAVARRLRHLSDECNRLLVLASILGREFGIDELAGLAGASHERVLTLLEEASAERVVADAQGPNSRFMFTHVLIRDALYNDLNAARRADLHRQAGEALEAVDGRDLDTRLAELAHHFRLAAPTGSADKAIEYARRAGDHAARVFAFEEAFRLYESALELVQDQAVRALLLERMALVAQLQGRLQEARGLLEEAVALHRMRGEKLAAGRVLTVLSNVLWRIGDPRRIDILTDALTLLETESPGPELVAGYSELAGHRAGEAAYGPAIDAADRALDLAVELALPEPARALGYRGEARATLGEREGIDDMCRALILAVEQGQERAAAVLHNNLAEALWLYDGPQAALAACREGMEFCRDRGISEWVRFIGGTRLPLLVWCGEPEQALAEAEPLVDQAEAAGDLTVLTEARAIQIHLAAERGSDNEQPEAVERFLARAPRRDHLYIVGVAAAAQLLVARNRNEQAKALLDELELIPAIHDEPRFISTLPALVRCAIAVGDRDLAGRFVTGIEPRTPLFAHSLCSAKALLAESAGEFDDAAVLHAEAADRWRSFGNLPEFAYALLGHGRCLLALERAGAVESLAEAANLFRSMEFQRTLAATEDLRAHVAVKAS